MVFSEGLKDEDSKQCFTGMNYHKNQVFVMGEKWFYNGLKRKKEGSEVTMEDTKTLEGLKQVGVGKEDIERLQLMMNRGIPTKEEQIRLLKKLRYEKLDDIHGRQQHLDRIDYLLYMMRQE